MESTPTPDPEIRFHRLSPWKGLVKRKSSKRSSKSKKPKRPRGRPRNPNPTKRKYKNKYRRKQKVVKKKRAAWRRRQRKPHEPRPYKYKIPRPNTTLTRSLKESPYRARLLLHPLKKVERPKFYRNLAPLSLPPDHPLLRAPMLHPPHLDPGLISPEELERQRDRLDTIRAIEKYSALASRLAGNSYLDYLQWVVIDSRSKKYPHPTPFRNCADPWQIALAQRLAPTVEFAAGIRPSRSKIPRFIWLTMPRGHDKTGSIARLVNFLMVFSRHRVSGYAAAGDKEQAGLLVAAMEQEARLNPWLAEHLSFRSWSVIGRRNSMLRVLAADGPSSFGLTPDFIVIDELTHWKNQDFWLSLLTAREKRPHSIMIVICNAGVKGSWAWDVFDAAQKSMHDNGLWWVYEAPGQMASWMNADAIEQMRSEMPEGEFLRVIGNQWVDPAIEYGFVPRADAEACMDPALSPAASSDEPNHVIAIDYGPVKDRTVCVVAHKTGDPPTVIIDRMEVFEGKDFPERRVPITRVEQWFEEACRQFKISLAIIDPFQMESLIQKFEKVLPVERFEPRGGKANYEMAQLLRSLIVSRRLRWYPGCGDVMVKGKRHTFADEIAELIVRSTAAGYRLDTLTRNHHDDRTVAAGLACVALVRNPGRRSLYTGDLFF